MRRLFPYLAIGALIYFICVSIHNYRATNPKEVKDSGYMNFSESTID